MQWGRPPGRYAYVIIRTCILYTNALDIYMTISQSFLYIHKYQSFWPANDNASTLYMCVCVCICGQQDSPLVRGARQGSLVILDGLHALHPDTLATLQRLIHDRCALIILYRMIKVYYEISLSVGYHTYYRAPYDSWTVIGSLRIDSNLTNPCQNSSSDPLYLSCLCRYMVSHHSFSPQSRII